MFALTPGPLVGWNTCRSIGAVVDCRLMLQLAEANGVAGHVVQIASGR